MQYDTIEELMLELSLYPNKKIDILEDCAKKSKYGWFTVAKDGNCALFDQHGELDDINKLKSIEEFMIPSDIKNINIPDSVTSIGKWAFSYCYSLTNVTIPTGVTHIGDCAFCDCNGLTSVMIGNNVTSIGWDAFSGCSSLTSVTIPDSVTSIGKCAFDDCSNLKELAFKGKTFEEVQSMENYPFGVEDESIIRCST